MKMFFFLVAVFCSLAFAYVTWLWTGVTITAPLQPEAIRCSANMPLLDMRKPFKVMSFNVQYMASKKYVFFYDVDGGPDQRPAKESIFWTLGEVARVIKDENPDFILLQEMADNDERTYKIDLLKELQQLLGNEYPCETSADYWRMAFMPHPSFMGPIGIKLTTLSKYSIQRSVRVQLPQMKKNPLLAHFYFHRAVQQVEIDTLDNQSNLVLLNTHLDAWAANSDIMDKQIARLDSLIVDQENLQKPWILGGDFNLLPPDGGKQLAELTRRGLGDYAPHFPIQVLYEKYNAVPPLEALVSADAKKWYTHFPNNPTVERPDRTIDYLFSSKQLRTLSAHVRQKDTLNISDHLPVVAVYQYNTL